MRTLAALSIGLLLGSGSLVLAEDEVAATVEVGKPAPNFEVPGIGGETFELASLKEQGKPVVLVFSRAHWCPFCSAHMQALQKAYPTIKEHGAELVVVFREEKTLDGLEKSRDAAKAEFTMVSDLGREKTKAYSPEGYAAYVVDGKGIVRAAFDGTKAKRPKVSDLLAALEKLDAAE